jgi:serine protease inhibitor
MRVQSGEEISNVRDNYVTWRVCITRVVRCFLKAPVCVLIREHSAIIIRRKSVGVNDIVCDRNAAGFELFANFANQCGEDQEIHRI